MKHITLFVFVVITFVTCSRKTVSKTERENTLFPKMVNKELRTHCAEEEYYNFYDSVVFWHKGKNIHQENGNSYLQCLLSTTPKDTFALLRMERERIWFLDINYQQYGENHMFPSQGKEFLLVNFDAVHEEEWSILTNCAIGSGSGTIMLESTEFDIELDDWIYTFRAIPLVDVLPSHHLYVSRFSVSKKYGFLEFIHSSSINMPDTICITSYY